MADAIHTTDQTGKNCYHVTQFHPIRDRPFNLKGGGYGFLFRSEFFFRTTQELEYFYFFVAQSANFFSRFQH